MDQPIEENGWSALLDRLVAHERRPGDIEPPFVKTLGFPFPEAWERGRLRSVWSVEARFLNERGVVFGGYLAALSDHALGMVTMSVLEAGESFATSDLRTSFFRPVTDGALTLEAQVIHRSRTLVHAEVALTREDSKLAAKTTATQVILRR